MSIIACLVGGPADGSLVSLAEPMLEFRIARPAKALRWNDLEDLTDESLAKINYGAYRRGREGKNVTFYEWTGWS